MIALLLLTGLIIAAGGLVYYWFFSPWSQLFGRFPYRATTNQRLIALSFDDGPNGADTKRIAKVLARHGVKATFFEVGRNVERQPEITKQLVADGHVIGNHAYSHAFRRYFSQPSMQTEINQSQEVLTRVIGRSPALFRPPWLFRQPWLLRSAQRLGLTPVSGVFASATEVFQPSAERIARAARYHAKPGVILIFHDGYNAKGASRVHTAAALDILIPQLKSDGYQFVTVDHLLNVPAYQA